MLEHLDYLNDCQDEMVALVQKLCNQNSGTYHVEGVRAVAEMLKAEYEGLGDEIHVHQVPDVETIDDDGNKVYSPLGPTIHVIKRPAVRPGIVLCIHTDTVYGPRSPFQQCRWLDEQTLNGPGVADAKGGQVVMLYALRAFEASPLSDSIGWEVIMNPDEEIGSPGSTPFLQSRARESDYGLLFEPSLPDGTLVSWRKGAGNFHFVARGRSVHSGRDFAAGRNAVAAMARMMTEIDGWNSDPDVTFNVAKISGGTAMNIVPDVAVGRVNVRVRTVEHLESVERRFAELVQRTNRLDGISVEQFGEFRNSPKTLDAETRRLQQIIESSGSDLDMPVQWRGTGGASDGNKMAAVGLPNIDTMGPQGGDIHSTDEFLLVDSLVPRAKLTALTLMKLGAAPLWKTS